jgi:hypothetical protein
MKMATQVDVSAMKVATKVDTLAWKVERVDSRLDAVQMNLRKDLEILKGVVQEIKHILKKLDAKGN